MPDRDWWRWGDIFDEARLRQLQNLSFLSYQTYIVSLCQPSGWQWDRVVFLSHFFVGLLGFFAQCCPDLLFQSKSSFTHENWASTTESFTPVMQLHYVNIYFHPPICPTQWQASKNVQGLNSSVWVLERCLLQMLLIKEFTKSLPLRMHLLAYTGTARE